MGCVELVRVDVVAGVTPDFDDIRFSEPLGYMNDNVAMWTMGMLACLFTAATRAVPVPIRGLAFGGAGVLGALSLMGESRGWAVALPVGLLVFVALGPGRPRKLVSVFVVGIGCALAAGPVLALHDEFNAARFDTQLADAVRAIGALGLALTLIGAAGALLDRRLPARPHPSLRARRVVGAATAALAAVLVAGLFVAGGAGERVSEAWDSFKRRAQAEEGGSASVTPGDPPRRVEGGVGGLRGPPVERRGRGQLPARVPPARQVRRTTPLRTLAPARRPGADRIDRRGPACRRSRRPAVVGPRRHRKSNAPCLCRGRRRHRRFRLLDGARVRRLVPRASRARRPCHRLSRDGGGHATCEHGREPPPQRRGAFAVVAAGLAVAIALALPWLAERDIARAADIWRNDPGGAHRALDRAATLNPLTARPALTAGSIAVQAHDFQRAETEFREALERDSDNSYALLELGLIESARGDRQRAVGLLEQATRLSPRDFLIARALRRARSGARLQPAAVNHQIARRAEARESDAP